jgi:hypothetical protein
VRWLMRPRLCLLLVSGTNGEFGADKVGGNAGRLQVARRQDVFMVDDGAATYGLRPA